MPCLIPVHFPSEIAGIEHRRHHHDQPQHPGLDRLALFRLSLGLCAFFNHAFPFPAQLRFIDTHRIALWLKLNPGKPYQAVACQPAANSEQYRFCTLPPDSPSRHPICVHPDQTPPQLVFRPRPTGHYCASTWRICYKRLVMGRDKRVCLFDHQKTAIFSATSPCYLSLAS